MELPLRPRRYNDAGGWIESLERCAAIPLADVLAPYLEDSESDHLERVLADLDEYVDGHENVVLQLGHSKARSPNNDRSKIPRNSV